MMTESCYATGDWSGTVVGSSLKVSLSFWGTWCDCPMHSKRKTASRMLPLIDGRPPQSLVWNGQDPMAGNLLRLLEMFRIASVRCWPNASSWFLCHTVAYSRPSKKESHPLDRLENWLGSSQLFHQSCSLPHECTSPCLDPWVQNLSSGAIHLESSSNSCSWSILTPNVLFLILTGPNTGIILGHTTNKVDKLIDKWSVTLSPNFIEKVRTNKSIKTYVFLYPCP